MKKQYPTIMHEWFEEVWNRRKAETIDRLHAPDAIAHGIVNENGTEVRGLTDFKAFHRRFLNAFPRLKIEVLQTVSEGDLVVARCIVRGKHEGQGLGLAATGKSVEFTGVCIARIQDGKIAEAWNNFDFLTLYSQLDALETLIQKPRL